MRVMRFANRVPLLYMGGRLRHDQGRDGRELEGLRPEAAEGRLPIGPMVVMVHMASVWVPFTSESKEAIAHYPGDHQGDYLRPAGMRAAAVGLSAAASAGRPRPNASATTSRMYIPHLALGLKEILDLSDRQETRDRQQPEQDAGTNASGEFVTLESLQSTRSTMHASDGTETRRQSCQDREAARETTMAAKKPGTGSTRCGPR